MFKRRLKKHKNVKSIVWSKVWISNWSDFRRLYNHSLLGDKLTFSHFSVILRKDHTVIPILNKIFENYER